MSATFAPRTYEIALRDGWQLFEVPDTGEPVAVAAKLVSSNPVSVQVAARHWPYPLVAVISDPNETRYSPLVQQHRVDRRVP